MTHMGLSCWENGKFTNYTTANGLSDDTCFFMLEDNQRNLWIGTGKGVDRFNGKTFRNYTSTDGLASSEMVAKACLADSHGYLWFGTQNGITSFDDKTFKTYSDLLGFTSRNSKQEILFRKFN